jgi:hypothetical protein
MAAIRSRTGTDLARCADPAGAATACGSRTGVGDVALSVGATLLVPRARGAPAVLLEHPAVPMATATRPAAAAATTLV